ncbi:MULTISPECIES: response regulator [unclassified Meiothermus]|uniref:response regulator n=1 Tax=unclassified Meiothermus TaxID=370471 RepID=UPI000D7CC61E|nr:response regulator [Meiothermus sp. Pnk-1]RYM40710.1 response regulator [Meiothermus sp. PNK-Is4]
MANPPLRILLVEDNPADVFLMEAALELGELPHTLLLARDGQEALELLRGARSQDSLPDLILLDLNLPRLSGFDVLQAIRQDPQLSHLTVVVFTTSNAHSDVQRAYALQANAYVVKPPGLDDLLRIISQLKSFWFEAASLPCSYPHLEGGRT